jgi:hypothetical protein
VFRQQCSVSNRSIERGVGRRAPEFVNLPKSDMAIAEPAACSENWTIGRKIARQRVASSQFEFADCQNPARPDWEAANASKIGC